MAPDQDSSRMKPREGYVSTGQGRLYFRELGHGPPIIVLHGGPDFDHFYLLPEMDKLAESFRLIYYDQRGRGRSAEGTRPEDVTIQSEMDDLTMIQDHFGLELSALLGHSFGGLLAMEYATRHPERVSHLILMNTAPGSHSDLLVFREHLHDLRTSEEKELLQALASGPAFRQGDLSVESDLYRIHFRPAVHPTDLENLVARLRKNFTEETVVLAREIEHRLNNETWDQEHYDLLPLLGRLKAPTLLIHGDRDFIPFGVATRIVRAIPSSTLSLLSDCGHFAYLERPDEVHRLIVELFTRSQPNASS